MVEKRQYDLEDRSMKEKGFVTIAVGKEKYYKMAFNLLRSYRLNSKSDVPFALICDRENEYTRLFDDVIILEKPNYSYMDKIEMLNNPPYCRNIFIDADCLVYNDLNSWWEYMPEKGVSCFGKTLQLDSDQGWFSYDGAGQYKDLISFIPKMHGGIIFFHNDELTEKIYKLAMDIAEHYSDFEFKIFKKPADEPIMALATAVYDNKPIELECLDGNNEFLFYPVAKKIKCNIAKGILSYTIDGKTWITNTRLLHWQNINTESAKYKTEIDRMSKNNVTVKMNQIKYYSQDYSKKIIQAIRWVTYEVNTKILRKTSIKKN